MHERPHPKWPGPDDKAVVTEMLADPNSYHWVECHEFIWKIVQRATIPSYLKEDVVQDAVMSVVMGLANFRFQSRLIYWLGTVTNSRIIDMVRKHGKHLSFSHPSFSKDMGEEAEALRIPDPKTTEQKCLIREELYEVHKELLAYLSTRLHATRDRHILILAWLDGLSQEEIAQRIGVSAPVVGYVIRTAQSHLRKKIRHQPPPEELPL